MRSTVEALTANFYAWELAGRGWRSYKEPVALEPPFAPFLGHFAPPGTIRDDARKPTFLSSLWEGLIGRPSEEHAAREELERPEPSSPRRRTGPLSQIEILVPPEAKIDPATSEAWLRAISAGTGPLSLELLGGGGRVSLRLAVSGEDLGQLRSQARAFFPGAVLRTVAPLRQCWDGESGAPAFALEFGLAREFMIPLRTFQARPDPLTPLLGALSGAGNGEVALVQILSEEVRSPWAPSVIASVTAPDGEPFFVDAPEITELAREKCSDPLYAVVLRVAARSGAEDGVWRLLRAATGALAQYGTPDRNELVPLAGGDSNALIEDILERTTRRSGMILSLAELSSLFRLPGSETRSPALIRVPEPEIVLPREVREGTGTVLGWSRHRGEEVPVHLPPEARLQHTYLIGGTGTGKSTLLERMILQDIEVGEGVGVLDPHGDLIEDVLGRIPEERVKDVILLDPADPEASAGWNILGAHSDAEKDILASDLVAVFRRLSTSWGDQMNAVLANAVLAFLESNRGGTLKDLRLFLLDETYRAAFLSTVQDDHITSFWTQEFPLLVGKKPQGPILTRLDTLLRSRLVREVVCEEEKPLNFRAMIDEGAIFLAKLSQGAIGQENAALLGSLLVSKFHQVGLSRQDTEMRSRRPFHLYLDEFHHLATPSMASLFSGVRKYRLGLTVAHQDLYQLHREMPEVERAVLTNAYTRVVFRVSDEDARKLEKGMGEFTSEDLTSLGRGEALCRVGRKDQSFRLRTEPLEAVPAERLERRREEVRRASLERHGKRGTARPSSEPPPKPIAPTRRPARDPEAPEGPVSSIMDPSALPGRGGAVHKYIQGLVTEWGRAEGFRSDIEKQLPDGRRVDVALTRGDLRIACEIAGTSTIEQEIRNVQKCLAGPFSHVAAISLDRHFLGELYAKISDELRSEELARVSVLSPEEFLAFLKAQEPDMRESTVRGYAVKVRHRVSGEGNEENRRKAVAEVMLRSVKRVREEAS
ncbi:MAG: type IV secretion system DNA-binding domain-containing protein [Gemmatimonadota bacterium]